MSAADSAGSESSPDRVVLLIDPDPSSELTAELAPDAGMIGVSLRDGDVELLGQRRGLESYVRDGKTMGIPLLYPWANRLGAHAYRVGDQHVTLRRGAEGLRYDPQGLPMHGLLAGSTAWLLEDTEGKPGTPRSSVTAHLAFGADPRLLESFPFPHRLELTYTLSGGRLSIRTTVTPTGLAAVPIAFGFHPYLQLPETPREDWHVELPALNHLENDERGIPTGARAAEPARAFTLGDATFDDGYDGLEDGAAFVVSAGGRRLTVRFDHGYPAVQIFAPSADPVICFEPMTAPVNALVSGDQLRLIAPGDQCTAQFSISVALTDD